MKMFKYWKAKLESAYTFMLKYSKITVGKQIRNMEESIRVNIWFRIIMGTKKCPLNCGMLLIPAPSLDLKKRAFVIIIRSLTPSPGSFSRGNSSLSTEYCGFTCGIISIALPCITV